MYSAEQFRERYKLIYTILYFIGVALFRDKTINLRLAFCTLITITGSISALYTLYISRNDFVTYLKTLSSSMQAVMGIAKLLQFARHKTRMEKMFVLIENTRQANVRSTLIRQEIMSNSDVLYKMMMKGLKAVYFFILAVIISYPAYAVLYLKKIELFFEIQFIGYPMENADTLTYILNFGSQVLEIFYAYQGTFVYDVVMFTLVFQIHILTQLLKASFNEAESQIGKNATSVNENVRSCLIILQDISNNIAELKTIFSAVIFFQIGSSSIKLALSLFCVVKTDWIGGYGFASLAFIEILSYSLLGTFLEETSQKLAHIIYDFKWYSTSIANQRMILFALLKSQNAECLTIGGVAPLNVQTAGSIFKSVYSYLMVLLNFAE